MKDDTQFDIENVFEIDDYMYFYSDMITDERTDAETEFLIDNLEIKPGHRILDIPCGYGRHANRLALYGCNITGIDYMKGFIEIAKKDADNKGVKPDFIVGDMRNIDYDEEYDAVLSLFTSFGYFDDNTNLMVLKRISKSLKKKGLFCIDTINRDVLLMNFKGCNIIEKDENYMIEKSSFDFQSGRIYTRRIIFRDSRLKIKDFFIRLYNPTELSQLLKTAGFITKKVFSGFNQHPVNRMSMRLLIIAEKI